MQNFINKIKQNYINYFEIKAIYLIEKCLIISCITCLFSILILSFYHSYYITHYLYDASLIIFRTGLMIGLFPFAFVLVIEKWKKDQNL